MIEKECNTFWARIHIAGDIEVAKHVIREYCEKGACVTIKPELFIYTGGQEDGMVVEFVNYPRFPNDRDIILKDAINLAHILRDKLFQHSVMVMSPSETYWFTRRQER